MSNGDQDQHEPVHVSIQNATEFLDHYLLPRGKQDCLKSNSAWHKSKGAPSTSVEEQVARKENSGSPEFTAFNVARMVIRPPESGRVTRKTLSLGSPLHDRYQVSWALRYPSPKVQIPIVRLSLLRSRTISGSRWALGRTSSRPERAARNADP
jgi:hypothetical protein